MPIDVSFADGPFGNALGDVNDALEATNAAGRIKLLNLLHNHFLGRLRRKTPAQLEAYLRNLNVWHEHESVSVYKTTELPCIAYAAITYGDETKLLFLGACAQYPHSEEFWWTDVIEPRLVHHL